jgi:hypothetical protein
MRHTRFAAPLLLALAVTGCRIDQNKTGEGDNVKVATPFGGLQVKTDAQDILHGIGLPAYPAANLVKKDRINGKDNGSADVNMSFGSFQLRVKAVDFHTDDSQQKVLDFYKKALSRYGSVIECSHKQPVGTPTHTTEGLTCDDDARPSADHVLVASDKSSDIQLKAGSKKHQHIVSVHTESDGTHFGLVSLDLPGDLHFGDTDSSDKDKDGSQ